MQYIDWHGEAHVVGRSLVVVSFGTALMNADDCARGVEDWRAARPSGGGVRGLHDLHLTRSVGHEPADRCHLT